MNVMIPSVPTIAPKKKTGDMTVRLAKAAPKNGPMATPRLIAVLNIPVVVPIPYSLPSSTVIAEADGREKALPVLPITHRNMIWVKFIEKGMRQRIITSTKLPTAISPLLVESLSENRPKGICRSDISSTFTVRAIPTCTEVNPMRILPS